MRTPTQNGAAAVAAPPLSDEVRAALPTFFIAGAAKAGTTSLHAYLAEHPDIAMTTLKEPSCFSGRTWEQRLGDYVGLFDRPAAIRGESSTGYSAYPWSELEPARIHATVPEARIVYLVRDPIERVVSHYAQNLWHAYPVRPFDELMEDLEDPMNMPVWCSRYATQLQRWLDLFPEERVLVLDQRDLARERTATVQRVAAWLGADPTFASPAWDQRHNTTTGRRELRPLARRLGRAGEALVRRRGTGRLLTRDLPVPELTPGQRARLEDLLRPEAERLRAMTGLALSHWSV